MRTGFHTCSLFKVPHPPFLESYLGLDSSPQSVGGLGLGLWWGLRPDYPLHTCLSHHLGRSQNFYGGLLIPGPKVAAMETTIVIGCGQVACPGEIPEGGQGRGVGREGGGPFLPHGVLLQEFLVFGPFVLKPDLDLGERKKKERSGP